jgi:hypothetical protein
VSDNVQFGVGPSFGKFSGGIALKKEPKVERGRWTLRDKGDGQDDWTNMYLGFIETFLIRKSVCGDPIRSSLENNSLQISKNSLLSL